MALIHLPPPDYSQYLLDSQDYWAGRRNEVNPPAPSYRPVKGLIRTKQKLGRYLDPFGCQGLMAEAKHHWEKFYSRFLVTAGAGQVLAGVSFLAMIVLAPWYLAVRWKYRRRYDYYWRVQQEIERTGQPVWVPYSKDRLKFIAVQPKAVWP